MNIEAVQKLIDAGHPFKKGDEIVFAELENGNKKIIGAMVIRNGSPDSSLSGSGMSQDEALADLIRNLND